MLPGRPKETGDFAKDHQAIKDWYTMASDWRDS